MNTLKLNELDNVAVCVEQNCSIPYGHKVALNDVKCGDFVIKYGHPIGRASKDIAKGEWVHSHNLKTHLDESTEYSYNPDFPKISSKSQTFFGFKRKNGKAGIRNDIYIIPTVGCVNSVANKIASKANELDLGSIDGVFALTHQFGCSQLGQDQINISKLLTSIALNPNASFVLFVGLGCENNGIGKLKDILKPYNRDNISFLVSQQCEDDVEEGFQIVKQMVEKAKVYTREECDISELTIGLKCGGSDGFSGITANPTVGKVSDKLVSMGGSAILTEVPEMFGAEQILMNKCLNQNVYSKYVDLIQNFKKYYQDLGFPVYENPSPGNKEGGITTLEEKSLGCVTKAGSSPIVDVLDYGDILTNKGLNVLNGPGNDLIAATALAAAGCQLILFTTGRGTPFSTVVPTIKISTNKILAEKKLNWIDFDASNSENEKLFELVISTASGTYHTKQEDSHEIAFFKQGVTL